MNAPLETVRVSERGKQQLIALKRRTGIEHWNVLCRWAFCLSLAEETVPPHEDIVANSSIEMAWKTFGGQHEALYRALLKNRCYKDGQGVETETLERYFKLHLHRGISYLYGNKDVHSMIGLISLLKTRVGQE